ncbi:hypothetical protein GOBAR_DD00109 [Gossypium barbadense]|nr:hypothetical protein GOBAR_DD00109 [Gossypium barbadense]
MSTIEVRGPSVRGYRRRKALLDLNVPPTEIREQEGTSQQAGSEQLTTQPAKNNSRRSRGRTVVDVDSVEVLDPRLLGRPARSTNNNLNRCRRLPPTPVVINCDRYINLESSPQSMVKEITKPQSLPKEPTFTCPICMGSLNEEMSTRCGHIFCKACIKAAIAAQGKCPTCRKRVTVKELIRVFLPSAS